MDLLLIIRGLAALAVVIWHSDGYRAEFPPLVNVPGRTAVWIFFGISGYVIAYGFVHERYKYTLSDLRDFYLNRFLRIYPLFIALSILAWATMFVTTKVSPITAWDLPAQLLAFQFNQNYILNGVFWTLGIELQFYLLAPILAWPLARQGQNYFFACIALYSLMVYWNQFASSQLDWSFDGRNIISNLPHFFIGMIACRLVYSVKPNQILAILSLAVACGVLGYTNWLYHKGSYWSVRGILLVDLTIFLFIIAHACCQRKEASKNIIYIGFTFLGTLSYGIYAWHTYLLTNITWLSTHVFALIGATIIAAYTSYQIIERPALKLKRHHPENHLH